MKKWGTFRLTQTKTYNWLVRDIFPAGDLGTKIMIIGNKLHEDGLMMRLKRMIEDDPTNGTYKEYPLLDNEGKCLWPEKFSNQKDIQDLKSMIGDETAWQREYLLNTVSEDDAVIRSEWINHYDELPKDFSLRYAITAIDLAISQKDWADKTAMLSAYVYGYNERLRIYILPHPVNEKISFPQTVEKAKEISLALGNGSPTKLVIEEAACQGSLIQTLIEQKIPAVGFKLKGQDKRTRLSLTTPFIKNGTVLFPKKGYQDLLHQLLYFGYERYDDLVDAFSMLVLYIIQDSKRPGGMTFLTMPNEVVEI